MGPKCPNLHFSLASTHKRSDLHAQVFCNPWHNETEFRTALVIECAHVSPFVHCGTIKLSVVASRSWLCTTCCSESCTTLCFIEGVSPVGKLLSFPPTRSSLRTCVLSNLGGGWVTYGHQPPWADRAATWLYNGLNFS